MATALDSGTGPGRRSTSAAIRTAPFLVWFTYLWKKEASEFDGSLAEQIFNTFAKMAQNYLLHYRIRQVLIHIWNCL